jgi:hypothetical protein
MARREKPCEQTEIERPTWDLRSNEPKSCEVHSVPLQEGLAQIAYGLYEFDERYWADKKVLFPNSNSWVAGGCIRNDVEVAQINFCSLCREAEDVWQQIKNLLSISLEQL